MEVDTFEIKRGSQKGFWSGKDVFPRIGPREAYKTVCWKELVVFYPCEESFRRSSEKLNRVLWREEEDEIESRTIANVVQREGEQIGEQIGEHLEHKAKEILIKDGLSQEGKLKDEQKAGIASSRPSELSAERIEQALEEINRDQGKELCIKRSELQESFEDPQAVKANISLDDVCCKKQKTSGREKGSPSKQNWYHLEKKCQERLSLALKGKHIRNQVLEHLLALLWRGKIDQAIAYLRALSPESLKKGEEIEKLIGYFERNRPFLSCYALRQKLGLRISSNPVEKANDLLVSDRQKHNGMSWSASGSCSLATVTCLRLNSQHLPWLRRRTIPFSFDHDLAP